MYLYTYTYIYECLYITVYIWKNLYLCVYLHIFMWTHMRKRNVYVYTYIYIYVHICICIHMYINTYTCAIYIHIRTYKSAYTYTYLMLISIKSSFSIVEYITDFRLLKVYENGLKSVKYTCSKWVLLVYYKISYQWCLEVKTSRKLGHSSCVCEMIIIT
jgi:hypothetical protein